MLASASCSLFCFALISTVAPSAAQVDPSNTGEPQSLVDEAQHAELERTDYDLEALVTTPLPHRRRRRTSSRRRSSNSLQKRVAHLEGEVKMMGALLAKLAEQLNGKPTGPSPAPTPKPAEPSPAPTPKPAEPSPAPNPDIPGVKACKGKQEGDECQVGDDKPRECTVHKKGSTYIPKGTLYCAFAKPAGPATTTPAPKPEKPLCTVSTFRKDKNCNPPWIVVCNDKKAEDKCQFAWGDKTLGGWCTACAECSTPVYCRVKEIHGFVPVPPKHMPMAVACKNKKPGDGCKGQRSSFNNHRAWEATTEWRGKCAEGEKGPFKGLKYCTPDSDPVADKMVKAEPDRYPHFIACEGKDPFEECQYKYKGSAVLAEGKCIWQINPYRGEYYSACMKGSTPSGRRRRRRRSR